MDNWTINEAIPTDTIRPTVCPSGLIACKEGTDRNSLVRGLEEQGIQTRMLFAGNLTKHPCFDEMRSLGKGYRIVGSLENTDRIMRDSFWIGVYPGMTKEMLDCMADRIIELCS